VNRDIPKWRIQLAGPAEVEGISRLLYESFVEYESLYTPEGFAATTPKAGEIQKRIDEGPVWIVIGNDEILGTVSAKVEDDSLYMRGMAVHPRMRGEGVGELLLGHVKEYARVSGFRRVFLSTTPFLDRGIRLYEKFGFKRTTEGPHDLFGTPLFSMEIVFEL